MALEVKAYGVSDIGRKRKRNEDSYIISPEIGLFAVADGMGGHNAGDEASKRAVEAVSAFLTERSEVLQAFARDPSPDRGAAAAHLVEASIHAACAAIHGAAAAEARL